MIVAGSVCNLGKLVFCNLMTRVSYLSDTPTLISVCIEGSGSLQAVSLKKTLLTRKGCWVNNKTVAIYCIESFYR